jgi:Ni,Fe-hydrogenase I large subunit
MATIHLDPNNRIEGHQEWVITIPATSQALTTAADVSGQMFRGFEQILIGRECMDAIIICGRI